MYICNIFYPYISCPLEKKKSRYVSTYSSNDQGVPKYKCLNIKLSYFIQKMEFNIYKSAMRGARWSNSIFSVMFLVLILSSWLAMKIRLPSSLQPYFFTQCFKVISKAKIKCYLRSFQHNRSKNIYSFILLYLGISSLVTEG